MAKHIKALIRVRVYLSPMHITYVFSACIFMPDCLSSANVFLKLPVSSAIIVMNYVVFENLERLDFSGRLLLLRFY